MINSPLLPLAYDNSIVETLIGGWTGVINSPLLLLAYDNRRIEPLIGVGGGWGWTGVTNSPLLSWHMITG